MPRTIKTTLELGGESAYKKGLQSVDRALKAMSKELSEATNKFAENSASLKNVSSVSSAYKNSIEQQKEKIESLKDAVSTCNKKYEEAVKKYEEAAAANGENSAETLKAADALYKASAALDGYKSKLSSAEKYLDSSQKKMKEFTDKNKNVLILAQTVENVKNKISYLSDGLIVLTKNTTAFQIGTNIAKNVKDEFTKLSDKIGELKDKFPKTANVIATAGKTISTPFKAMKPIIQNVSGVFELAARKAGTIKEKLEPAINVCKNVAKAAGEITFKTAEIGAKTVSAAINGAAKALSMYTKTVTVVTAAAAGATLALTTAAVNSYADYEQLAGGVETLFNSSSATVMEYANNAYKTAGLSANEYLETVTSFSASLLQSLGGDTEAAAQYADLAITDMSDNANKMGTDMQSIQNAYQGFAKQNYTMLDNLKLGYGGTKEEMQRLLEDAAKISGIEYDISSYSDIVSAIHVVQDEMDITGTTAKEASTTIQGSVNSMESAWTNMLAGISTDNSDLEGLLANLFDSVVAVGDNLIPRIETTLDNLGSAIKTVIPNIMKQIPKFIKTAIPSMIASVSRLAITLVESLGEAFALFPELISSLVEMASNNFPSILTTLTNGFNNILLSLADSIIVALPVVINMILPGLIDGVTNLVLGLCERIPELLPLLIEGAVVLFSGLIDSLNQVINTLMPILPEIITQISTALIENLPVLLEGALQLFLGLIQALDQIVGQLMPMLPELITNICNTLINNIPAIISAGFDLLIGLIEGITECIPTLVQKIPEIVDSIVNEFSNNIGQLITAGIDLIVALATGLPKAIPDIILAIPEIIVAIIDTIMETDWLQIGIDIIRGLADGLIDGVNVIWEKIKEMASNLLKSIKNALGIHSPSKLFRDEVGTYLAQGIGVGFEGEMEKVTKQMQKAVPSDFDTVVNADINSFSAKPSTSSVTNNNKTVNYIFENVTINSNSDAENLSYKLEAMKRKAAIATGGI